MSGRSTKYSVPRDNNTCLVSPTAHDWPSLLERNSYLLTGYPDWILRLRDNSRSEVRRLLGIPFNTQPMVVGGHQPELFHPGVWFKNFVLHRIAETYDCLPLHIQIDHDIVREIDLSTPHNRPGKLSLTTVRLPTNEQGAYLPWENTRCSHTLREQWKGASEQVAQNLNAMGITPLIATRWNDFEKYLGEYKAMGQVTSQVRRSIEQDIGLNNHEAPMSSLANGKSFAEFSYRCIDEGIRLQEIYNESRNIFRQERGISNVGQPVPELRRVDDWIEAPFWLYHTTEAAAKISGNTHFRRAAWIRLSHQKIELANAPSSNATIYLVSGRSIPSWLEQHQIWVNQGVCLRPRALMTTLYLRLFVGDLFLHGIGGGIYDELTDQIVKAFWQIDMPAFVVASASLHLPFDQQTLQQSQPVAGQSKEDVERLARQIRSAPESLLDLSNQEQNSQKREFDRLLSQMPPKGQKRGWHREMADLRVRIRKSISNTVQQLDRQSLELIERTRISKIVRSREFSFALFPENSVTSRLRVLAEHAVCTECTSHESGSKLKDGETSTLAAREC